MTLVGSIPGEPTDRQRISAWLREKLFERRIVLVTGFLDNAVAAETAAALLALDAAGEALIELHLDSADGALESAFVIADTIGQLRSPLHILCRGQVGGPAVSILVAAGRRSASPHTQFRLFQPTVRLAGTPESIASQSRQQQALLWKLYAGLSRLTGRPVEEIAEDIRRGRSLDAREALDYGLIDEIIASR